MAHGGSTGAKIGILEGMRNNPPAPTLAQLCRDRPTVVDLAREISILTMSAASKS
jgi:hypothetical protein